MKHYADEKQEIKNILLEEMKNHLTLEEMVLFEKLEADRISDRIVKAIHEE